MLKQLIACLRAIWTGAGKSGKGGSELVSPLSFREVFADVQGLLKSVAGSFPSPTDTAQGWGLYFCTKAYWLGEAIGRLCDLGLATEARILLRALTDHYITFRYILLDPTNRAEQFAEFDVIERMRWLKAVRDFNIHGFSEEQLDAWEAEAQPDYAAVVKGFRTKKGKVKKAWHGSNLRQMAKDVDPDLEKLYIFLFRDTSESVHPSNRDTRHYFRKSSDGSISAALEADNQEREDPEVVSLWACLLNTHLVDHLNDALHLGRESEIRALEEKRISIMEARKTAGI